MPGRNRTPTYPPVPPGGQHDRPGHGPDHDRVPGTDDDVEAAVGKNPAGGGG